ncbi:hypothetical protein [Burkholderia multivorans]|uniref:hypothetical protein n=1 Tax=Burkholderia multivorans TaxID=87883 RepID=UPI001E511EEF|nr:hypothetical protein [Burkholderia multivorans]
MFANTLKWLIEAPDRRNAVGDAYRPFVTSATRPNVGTLGGHYRVAADRIGNVLRRHGIACSAGVTPPDSSARNAIARSSSDGSPSPDDTSSTICRNARSYASRLSSSARITSAHRLGSAQLSPSAQVRRGPLTDALLEVQGLTENAFLAPNVVGTLNVPRHGSFMHGRAEPAAFVELKLPAVALAAPDAQRQFVERATAIVLSRAGGRLTPAQGQVNVVHTVDGGWGHCRTTLR